MVHIFQAIIRAVLPVAHAAESIINDPKGGPATEAQAVTDFITRLQTMVVGAAGAIAMAMIIWGAIVLGTAGGNEEKMAKGKKILTYSIGGLIFILISGFLIGAFIRILGGEVS